MLNKIIKNTAWISIANVIGKGLAFLLAIYIARYLGAELYGKFSFALSLVGILAVVADFGLNNLTIREIARKKEATKKYLDNLITLKLLLSVISFVLIAFCLWILNKDQITVQLTYLAGLFIIINSFDQFFYAIFRAWEKIKFEAIGRIFYNVILFGLGMLFIYLALSQTELMFAYVLAAICSLGLSTIFIFKYFSKFEISFDLDFWKKILKESWPFALSSIFIILYFKIDTVMLSQMRTDAEVGWYNAAYNLVFALFLIPTVFDAIFYPILSRTFAQKKEFIYTVKKIFLYAIVIALPTGIIIYLIKTPLIDWVYANKYPAAAGILGILIWSFVLSLINRFPFIINAANLQKLITKQIAIGVTANIILNLFLIPKYGAIGAAYATVASEIIAIFLLFYYAMHSYRKQIFHEN